MAQHPLRAEIQFPEKIPLGCTFIRVNNYFVCGPKYAKFSLSNVGGVVDDQELFRFFFDMCGELWSTNGLEFHVSLDPLKMHFFGILYLDP